MAGRSQTGLVVCTSIEDYVAGKIKNMSLLDQKKKLTASITSKLVMQTRVQSF